jgi:hypothetical protein
MSSCPNYREQPSFFESGMYEAWCAMAPLRGDLFLTSFYGNGATKFDGLSDIPTISNLLEISANGTISRKQAVKDSDDFAQHCDVELFQVERHPKLGHYELDSLWQRGF